MSGNVLTVKELQVELNRLAQVHATLVTMKPMICNDQGQQLWKQAAQELEESTRSVRLALAITEAGQQYGMFAQWRNAHG